MPAARPYRPPWERRPSERLKDATPAESPKGGGRSPYRLGKAFEVSVKTQLERRGYFVIRAQASKGKIDLLAVAKDRPALFIQAKRLGQISSAEWNEVCEIAWAHGGWPVLCKRLSPRTTGFFRLDALREFRSRTSSMTQFDPATGAELHPPLALPI